MLSVIVLTHNEEKHIRRCVNSLKQLTGNIFVVDSYSTDRTVEICKELGVRISQRSWKNYSDQFQWGLDNNPFSTDWIMRMDADEYIEPSLADELSYVLGKQEVNVSGFYIRRKYFFSGKWVRYGGVYPLKLLRVWKAGLGRIEERWMDEHIVLDDNCSTALLKEHIVDDNLNDTKWWVDKHNKYADREMIDILNGKYGFFCKDDSLTKDDVRSQASLKRKVKERIYNRLPIFIRPTLYFFYRYFFRLGFLDGKVGFAFHFLQGYWYRMIVDLRVYEAEKEMKGMITNTERIAALEKMTSLNLH